MFRLWKSVWIGLSTAPTKSRSILLKYHRVKTQRPFQLSEPHLEPQGQQAALLSQDHQNNRIVLLGLSAHLRQTKLLHLVDLPPHCVPVPLQLPLSISQSLQVFLVLLLPALQILLLVLQLLLLLLYLLLLQWMEGLIGNERICEHIQICPKLQQDLDW